MTPETPAPYMPSPWAFRIQGPMVQLAAICMALFTGQTFSVVLRTHCWGCAGKPGWVANSGTMGLSLALGLCLVSIGTGFWHNRWAGGVSTMRRDRHKTWYTRYSLLAIPAVLLCVPFGQWLASTWPLPPTAWLVLFLGTVATVSTSSLAGCYRLEALARTQRDLLVQAQLAPHFLFNSLSTLKGQIADEPMEAQATADRLSRLFRDLMDMGSQASVPLSRELAFVEAYLGLEQARLGARLQVDIQVPDELEAFPVPPLSLQVLVENAVRQAIAPRVEGGLLSIRASRIPAGLQLVVGDPGDGQAADPGTGRGLQVLRARQARPSDLRFDRVPEGHQATLILRHA